MGYQWVGAYTSHDKKVVDALTRLNVIHLPEEVEYAVTQNIRNMGLSKERKKYLLEKIKLSKEFKKYGVEDIRFCQKSWPQNITVDQADRLELEQMKAQLGVIKTLGLAPDHPRGAPPTESKAPAHRVTGADPA